MDNQSKFVVVATITVYANSLAEAGLVIQSRVQMAVPTEDKHAVYIEDLRTTRAKQS